MARAHSIHVVLDPSVHASHASHLKAAFTVKHELDSWADKHDPDRKFLYWSVRDSGGGYGDGIPRPFSSTRQRREEPSEG